MKTRSTNRKATAKKTRSKSIFDIYTKAGFVYHGENYTTAQDFGSRFKRLSLYEESELVISATSGV